MKQLSDGVHGGWAINIQGSGGADAGEMRFGIDGNGAGFPGDAAVANVRSDDGLWHHVVGVRDTTVPELRIYVDGQYAGNDASISTTGSVSNDYELMLGIRDSLSGDWVGGLDDIRIFSYMLTPAQIKILYNQGAAVRFGQ
jgi:hypothetical protein